MIDHLPRASNFREAVAADEELAEHVLARGDPPPAKPRFAEWSPEVDQLAAVVDLLSHLISVQVAANGGKAKDPKTTPRPETAIDRVKRRMASRDFDDLVRIFAPHEAGRLTGPPERQESDMPE